MKFARTAIPDVVVLEPHLFEDERGCFFESWNSRALRDALGLDITFVQDNQSRSAFGVLRGLHYQVSQPQGKLVRVTRGHAFDVAVDLRRTSPSFGKWVGMSLSEDNHRIAWIPPGFAHGFLALSETVDFLYKTTDYYSPQSERTLLWNDDDVSISWPKIDGGPRVSAKDRCGVGLSASEYFDLQT